MMLVRATLVLMMVLLCSKPEHELPHQPQFLPSPRNLSITGLLRWALFYFAAPYCMARCLIFILPLNLGGGQLKTPYIFISSQRGRRPHCHAEWKTSSNITRWGKYALCSPGFTIWTSNDNTESPKMPTLQMKFSTNLLWNYAQVSWIRASDVTVLSVGHLTFSSGQQPTSYKLLLMYHC